MNSPIPEVQALFAVMGVSSITIAAIGFCVSVLALVLLWFQRRKLLKAIADVKFELSEVGKVVKKWHEDELRSSREQNAIITELVAELGYDVSQTLTAAAAHVSILGIGKILGPLISPMEPVLRTSPSGMRENTLKRMVHELRMESVQEGIRASCDHEFDTCGKCGRKLEKADAESGPGTG